MCLLCEVYVVIVPQFLCQVQKLWYNERDYDTTGMPWCHQNMRSGGGEEKMLRKLVRAVFTIVGAVLGYGAFLLVKFLARFFGHDDWVNFTNMQEFYISVSFALIFGLIFFQLTPDDQETGPIRWRTTSNRI